MTIINKQEALLRNQPVILPIPTAKKGFNTTNANSPLIG